MASHPQNKAGDGTHSGDLLFTPLTVALLCPPPILFHARRGGAQRWARISDISMSFLFSLNIGVFFAAHFGKDLLEHGGITAKHCRDGSRKFLIPGSLPQSVPGNPGVLIVIARLPQRSRICWDPPNALDPKFALAVVLLVE